MNINNLYESLNFFIFAFFELSILFLAISFFVEVISTKINPKKIKNVLSSKRGGYFTASLFGSITPFCSCSSIPLTIGLIKAKAGFGPVMTFLFTSPLINPIIIVVFIVAFGVKITIIYTFVALLVSLSAGYLLERFGFEKYIKLESSILSCATPDNSSYKATSSQSCCNKEVTKKNIYKELWINTYKQFLSFLPYITIGIGIGAIIHGFIPQEFITKYLGTHNIFSVPLSAILGLPLYIRASAMVGLAPELIDKGVNLGSIFALTVAGAGASFPELIMLKKIFKLPIILFFLVTVFTIAIGVGFLINIYFS